MLYYQYWTKEYKHEYLFTFRGEKYLVHSIVSLTQKGKKYLDTTKDKAILTEHFINLDGKECWTYEIGWAYGVNKPLRVSTDIHPNKIIDKVVVRASPDYTEREIFGVQATSYTNGTKNAKKEWEVPEVQKAWVYFILIFIGAAIFKDWYIKLIIRIAACWYFRIYSHAYVNAYTTYAHEEDNEILKNKYEVLHGVKFNKEDNNE